MHLAIHLTLLMGSCIVAAIPIQHAQISVEITSMDGQDQLDALHSTEGLVMNRTSQDDDDDLLENLPFNFTLGVQYVNRRGGQDKDLDFGFDDSKADTFVRGELGFSTEFAFLDGKLINGNKALGIHPRPISPGWTSLRSLKDDTPSSIFDLLVYSTGSGERQRYVIEFANSGKFTSVTFYLNPLHSFRFPRALTSGFFNWKMKALAPYRSNRGNRSSGALGMVSNTTYIPSYLAFSSTYSLSWHHNRKRNRSPQSASSYSWASSEFVWWNQWRFCRRVTLDTDSPVCCHREGKRWR